MSRRALVRDQPGTGGLRERIRDADLRLGTLSKCAPSLVGKRGTNVAVSRLMKPMTKVLALGTVAGAAVFATSWIARRRSFDERVTREFPAVGTRDGAGVARTTAASETDDGVGRAGISDVDPQPLMGMGEAVDPDAIESAHHELPDLRARLPQPGKNLP